MELQTIHAGRRKATGRNRVSPLRARGLIPAVLYGGNEETVSLAVEEREMESHLRHHHKVYSLSLDGGEIPVYLQDVHWDILSDRPLHMDFLRIDMSKPIKTTVELTYIGHPVGASHGGTLVRDRVSLAISCLPGEMPEEIEVHVAHLDIGDTLLAGSLQLPPGVTTPVADEVIICHVTTASVVGLEEEETPEETPEEGAPEAQPDDAAPDKKPERG